MSSFRIVPISNEFIQQVLNSRRDSFGNELVEQVAKGKGPCRVSLKPFRVGEDKRLLFSYSPFDISNAFNQPGPVFIHSEPVEPYSDVSRFPIEIKNDPVAFPLTLIGYTRDQKMVYTKLVGNRDVDEMIEEIFAKRAEVSFLHARNAEAGCFICKIERA